MTYQSFTLLSRAKTLSSSTGQGVVLLPGELLSLSGALHTTGWLHVTQITVKNPHAQSFQLLNNTKQTVTHFRSREQAKVKTWSGIRLGGGRREEWRQIEQAGRALTDGLRYWFVVRFRKKEAFLCDQQAWSAMWAPESSPDGLRVPGHDLWAPVNVIKQAGTRILQQSPYPWGLPAQGMHFTVTGLQICVTPTIWAMYIFWSCYFQPSVYVVFISPGTVRRYNVALLRAFPRRAADWQKTKNAHIPQAICNAIFPKSSFIIIILL